jgi:hypothetical protein
MRPQTFDVLRRGVESALLASIPQVIVPKIEEKLFLPEGEDADLGPRLVEALAARLGKRLPEDVKWLGAASFHFGYAAIWGVMYALVQQRVRMNPWLGGAALSGFIYAITFPDWGGAVRCGSEPAPRFRSWPKEIVLASAPICFGFGTALLYGQGPKRRSSGW